MTGKELSKSAVKIDKDSVGGISIDIIDIQNLIDSIILECVNPLWDKDNPPKMDDISDRLNAIVHPVVIASANETQSLDVEGIVAGSVLKWKSNILNLVEFRYSGYNVSEAIQGISDQLSSLIDLHTTFLENGGKEENSLFVKNASDIEKAFEEVRIELKQHFGLD